MIKCNSCICKAEVDVHIQKYTEYDFIDIGDVALCRGCLDKLDERSLNEKCSLCNNEAEEDIYVKEYKQRGFKEKCDAQICNNCLDKMKND